MAAQASEPCGARAKTRFAMKRRRIPYTAKIKCWVLTSPTLSALAQLLQALEGIRPDHLAVRRLERRGRPGQHLARHLQCRNALRSRPSLNGRGSVEEGHLVAVDRVGPAAGAACPLQIDALGIGRRQARRRLAAIGSEDPHEVAAPREDEHAARVLSGGLAGLAGRQDL